MTESTAALDKKARKASDSSIIKLLPALVEHTRWNDPVKLREILVELSEKTRLSYPAIHKRIERDLRHGLSPTPMQSLPKNLVELSTPVIKLDDVVLTEQLKTEVLAIIQEHDRVEDLAAFDLKPRHKVLLYGAPGNGKTLLAEALASSMDIPFVKAKYSGLVGSHLGETGKNIASIMDYAESGPCLLFLDEFDGLAIDRAATGDVTEMRRVTNQLLISLDKLPHYCVFVAATNSENLIDKAILRRFDFSLNIQAPTPELILQLARKELDPARTPGNDVLHFAPRIAKMKLKNMSETVMLCQQIRRDLVLNDGWGIEAILNKTPAQNF